MRKKKFSKLRNSGTGDETLHSFALVSHGVGIMHAFLHRCRNIIACYSAHFADEIDVARIHQGAVSVYLVISYADYDGRQAETHSLPSRRAAASYHQVGLGHKS